MRVRAARGVVDMRRVMMMPKVRRGVMRMSRMSPIIYFIIL